MSLIRSVTNLTAANSVECLGLNPFDHYKTVYLCPYNLEVDEISHIHRS